jgi:hypothetical protein
MHETARAISCSTFGSPHRRGRGFEMAALDGRARGDVGGARTAKGLGLEAARVREL